jgi:hypothetical protein
MKGPTEPARYVTVPPVEISAGRRHVIDNDAAEEAALGPGWYDSPAMVTSKRTPEAPTGGQTPSDNGADDALGSSSRVCPACGQPFTPKRPWQRGCGLPACRAAGSRRRHQQAIRRAFEQIDQALARPDIAAARIIIRAQLRKLTIRSARSESPDR